MTKRLDYNQIAPNGAKALGGVYGYVMQSGLPAELVELVYLRVSQINNCVACAMRASSRRSAMGAIVRQCPMRPDAAE